MKTITAKYDGFCAATGAQETAALNGTNEALLWRAQAALAAALYNMGEPDEGLACAEQALHLLNTYLMENELCKQ